jgi:hypothetical protein
MRSKPGSDGRRVRVAKVPRFMLMVQGPNWEDVEDVELPHPPSEGEPIETQYGKCLVTLVEPMPDNPSYSGKIVARLVT